MSGNEPGSPVIGESGHLAVLHPLLHFLNEGTLLAGDSSDDNVVDVLDFSLLRARFGTNSQDADYNGDGVVDGGDIVYLLNYLYRGGPAPEPQEVGDVNCDGVVDGSDVVYLLNYLYRNGPPPGPPPSRPMKPAEGGFAM